MNVLKDISTNELVKLLVEAVDCNCRDVEAKIRAELSLRNDSLVAPQYALA